MRLMFAFAAAVLFPQRFVYLVKCANMGKAAYLCSELVTSQRKARIKFHSIFYVLFENSSLSTQVQSCGCERERKGVFFSHQYCYSLKRKECKSKLEYLYVSRFNNMKAYMWCQPNVCKHAFPCVWLSNKLTMFPVWGFYLRGLRKTHAL